MNTTQLNKLYDLLYDKADRLIKEANPCKHVNGICEVDRVRHEGKQKGCCGGCPYLKSNGCTVKCLMCKLWLCSYIGKCNPELEHKLWRLQRVAWRFGLLEIRRPKKVAMKYAIEINERKNL